MKEVVYTVFVKILKLRGMHSMKSLSFSPGR